MNQCLADQAGPFPPSRDGHPSRRDVLRGAALVAAGSALPWAQAQDPYPSKPVTLIVPYPPGGNTDVVARAYAVPLAKALGQPVVVENKAGAGGAVDAAIAARAPADGYTMVIGDLGLLCINRYANPSLPYDPAKDFLPVSTTATVSVVVTGRRDLPVNSFKEFIALARSQPGKFRCGTGGPGTIGHLSLEMIKSMAGIDLLHVPYRGGAPALNDLMGGHIDIMIDGAAYTSAKSGAVKALAVTGARIPALPEVPTVAESGVPGFHFSNFWGFLMPAHSPATAVARIAGEIQKIAASPQVRAQLEGGGILAQASSDKEFADLIRRSYEQVGKIVKSANISFG